MMIGLYAGSFDPMTNGHVAVLQDALTLFSEIIVAIGIHPTKPGFLPRDVRRSVIENVSNEIGARDRIRVREFSGLVVDLAREEGATAIVRGVRDGTDLDYEMQMVGMNRSMAPHLPTVLVPALPDTRHITATLVRQIVSLGGDVSPFVPAATLAALNARAK